VGNCDWLNGTGVPFECITNLYTYMRYSYGSIHQLVQ
jgi:hypothetical protein